MHILIIPSFYPEESSPTSGSFFRNLTKTITKKVDKIGTVYVEQKSLKKILSNPNSSLFKITKIHEEDIFTYRICAYNLFNQYKIGARIWMKLTEILVDIYVKDNGLPDVIHAHNVFNGGRVAMTCSIKYNIPYIITEHSSGFFLNEYVNKYFSICRPVFLNSSCYTTVSTMLAKFIANSCNISEPVILPNVTDTDFFRIDIREIKNSSFTFLSIGNLTQNKGHYFLIQAFSRFRINYPESLLYIYGSGPEYKRLFQLILNLKLYNNVFLKGTVFPKDLVKIYQRSHCFILPSIKETFGVVLIEAMACGLPIISTSSGGPNDLINSVNGIIVEPGNISQMAEAMQYIVNFYYLYKSEDIRADIVNKFSIDVIGNKLLYLYKNVSNKKK